MKQVGIIYKFTIIAKYKFDGHKPFYVGQHFDLDDFDIYIGSGAIWTDFITRLKTDFPTCWRKLIKREVLYQRPCSQIVLDKMEEYYIKKEKSHYSYKIGGCNVLWGTANKFGSGNPAKDPLVRKKMSDKAKERTSRKEVREFISKMQTGRKHSLKVKNKISESLKGRKFTKEHKNKISESLKGRKFTKEHLLNMSKSQMGKKRSEEWRKEHSKAMKGEKHPMYGTRFKWINNGKNNKRLSLNSEIPIGWNDGYIQKRKTKL